MACSALLCGRFADSHESFLQASKRSNIGSAVLEGGRSNDIHEFCLQGAKGKDMDAQKGAMSSLKEFALLILRKCVLRLGNVTYELFRPAM